jgi:CubicO group peptidase (beta-lactamase class C family)
VPSAGFTRNFFSHITQTSPIGPLHGTPLPITQGHVMKSIDAAAIAAAILCFSFAAQAADPLPRAKPEEVGMSSERLALIDKALTAEIASGQIPGAVLAVARRGKLVYFEAFGYVDKATNAPMTRDAIFGIASMTKPMVAVAALQLYEQGKLLMDEPLAKYLPKFADMQVAIMDARKGNIVERVPAARKITIQDLFRHTSGLTYGSDATPVHKLYPRTTAGLSGTEFLDRLSSLPLVYQPGTVWEYGYNLDVLGLVIESITKQPLGRYLEDNLWKPLGMADTGFVIPADKAARHAKPLPVDPEAGRPQSTPTYAQPPKFECGGGCAVSTAGDYLRFAQMLLNKGQFGEKRILGRKTVEYMLSNQLGPEIKNQVGLLSPVNADYGFGLGVAVRTTPGIVRVAGSVGEFSWNGAFGTDWWGDPVEQLVAVWMINAPAPGAPKPRLRQMVRALVTQAILD